ncbi:PREDICTED: uncharacterized protein LOC105116165 [Populus euphratica]|uniref:Uncharacterized protein LOC105116165 n=1 Tax=Populus euphratica TaxID=75702 RepID=A0AAJ6TI84_POPEU|nr:PREDICTED: uncharacterized protein LOC105116165 [Populus euphratica]
MEQTYTHIRREALCQAVMTTSGGGDILMRPVSSFMGIPIGGMNSKLRSPVMEMVLCVGSRCLIFQLSISNTVPQRLHNFLTDCNITFVRICDGKDRKKLRNSRHQLTITRLLDLRRFLRSEDEEHIYFGCKMDITASDWGREDLIFYQIRQASISAYVSFKIGKDLRACQCVSI